MRHIVDELILSNIISLMFNLRATIQFCVLCNQDEARTNYNETETSDNEVNTTTVITPQEKCKQM